MTKELEEKLNEFNVEGNTREQLENFENAYEQIRESEDGDLSFVQWIKVNTDNEEMQGLSEEQKFFLGVGVLISYIGKAINGGEMV